MDIVHGEVLLDEICCSSQVKSSQVVNLRDHPIVPTLYRVSRQIIYPRSFCYSPPYFILTGIPEPLAVTYYDFLAFGNSSTPGPFTSGAFGANFGFAGTQDKDADSSLIVRVRLVVVVAAAAA